MARVAGLLVAALVALVGCTSPPLGTGGQTPDHGRAPTASGALTTVTPAALSAVTQTPPAVSVAGGSSAGQVAAAVSASLFRSAPVVLAVMADDPAGAVRAARIARSMGLPLLLGDPPAAATTTGATAGTEPVGSGPLAREVARLHPTTVLAIGAAAGRLSGVSSADVVDVDPGEAPLQRALAALPSVARPAPLASTTLLVRRAAVATGGTSANERAATAPALVAAVTATAGGVGATVVPVGEDDLRGDAATVTAMAQAPRGPVVAAGSGFGPVPTLTRRIRLARTGTQLPGGGQRMFPGRALVALYGHPGGAGLGVLGEQGPDETTRRAATVAAPYAPLYDVPVVPTLEIIATVASGSAGADGNYCNESSVESLRPMVDAATRAGQYVVLDLQPGRADLVDQARRYQSLLEQPDVGLALDPEWALGPDQLPLKQIGSVSAEQVNDVVRWLAGVTAAANLPQKVLVVHQFRPAMVRDVGRLDLGHEEVALLVHVDGQGARLSKESTWSRIVATTPAGVFLGWKNFYDEDPQTASPADTVNRSPRPLMVSYQ